MDYELDTYSPSSRRSRPLAWLAVASGVLLVLFTLGSPKAAPLHEATHSPAIGTPADKSSDPLTTSSIISASPVKLVNMPASEAQALPLPQSERHLLIVLLFVCFTIMSIGGFALSRRGWRDAVQRSTGKNR